MRSPLSAAAVVLFCSTGAHAALSIDVSDNGVSIGSETTAASTASLTITSDPAFASITVDVIGNTVWGQGNLSSTVQAVRSSLVSGIVGLDVFVIQTQVTVHKTESTFSVDNSGNLEQVTTALTFSNIHYPFAAVTFPSGTTQSSVGPIYNAGQLFSLDGNVYYISFYGPGQGVSGSIDLATNSPELSTWAMMLLGFAGLGFASSRASRRLHRKESWPAGRFLRARLGAASPVRA